MGIEVCLPPGPQRTLRPSSSSLTWPGCCRSGGWARAAWRKRLCSGLRLPICNVGLGVQSLATLRCFAEVLGRGAPPSSCRGCGWMVFLLLGVCRLKVHDVLPPPEGRVLLRAEHSPKRLGRGPHAAGMGIPEPLGPLG